MRDVLAQITRLFFKLPPLYKKGLFGVAGVLFAILIWMMACHPFSSFVPLYPNQELTEGEKKELRNYLNLLGIPYKDKAQLLVPAKRAEHIRMDWLSNGKGEKGKGFELFDTNTWIKGEKELQVLEMRALKGQLEHDLTEFENIQHASVILDLAPARQFGSNLTKTKASVILTLMPHAHLSSSQLRAITYHLAGAVRGLDANMVAISDTKGRLYQAIDPDAKEERSDHILMVELQLQDRIERLLEKVVGSDNFHATVQIGPTQIAEVGVVLNKQLVDPTVQEEIGKQIMTIGRGFGIEIAPTIDRLPFDKRRSVWQETRATGSYAGMVFYLLMVLIAGIALFPFIRFLKKRKKEEGDPLSDVMTRIDIDFLVNSLKGEGAETIALMLSYLEPKRAEEILAAFPAPFQEEVLAQLEKVS